MSFLDVARTRAFYDSAVIFRGEFRSTAAVRWATGDGVKTSTGLAEGRILSVGQIRRGMSEVLGGAPPRVECTLDLANHDNQLAAYFRGNATTSASVDYLDDGFRNLTGKLYLWVKDPISGASFEEALTPTMVVTGEPETEGFIVRLQLSSKDGAILGESVIGAVTVQKAIDSDDGGHGDGLYVDRVGGSGAYAQGDFEVATRSFKQAFDQVVPFMYGPTEIPMLLVSDSSEVEELQFLLFASIVEPNIEGFADWDIFSTWGKPPEFDDLRQVMTGTVQIANPTDQKIWKIRRDIETDAGTKAIWIVGITSRRAAHSVGGELTRDAQADLAHKKHYVVPDVSWLGISFPPPPIASAYRGPVAVMAAMARDHAELGSAAIDATSFLRVAKAFQTLQGVCGGLFDAKQKLADEFQKIGRAYGLLSWVENDDTLHALVGWAQEDKDEIAAGTPYHIAASEILDGWREVQRDDPPALGAIADRVDVRWSQQRLDFYTPDLLPDRQPGATELPSSERKTDEIDGDWIYPPRAADVLQSRVSRLSFISRRIEFVGRSWLATEPIGTIYFVSHPRGLGDNAGGGYVQRPMRLESTEFTWGEDGCKVVLVDLEGDFETKPSTLDTIDTWIASQTANGDTFQFTSGSPTVIAGAGNTRKFSAADVGRHLWSFGALDEALQRSRKIVTFTDATHVDVEFNYGANELVTCDANTGWDSKVLIVDNQGTKGSSYRPDKIRACREDTGLFEDGVTPGFQLV